MKAHGDERLLLYLSPSRDNHLRPLHITGSATEDKMNNVLSIYLTLAFCILIGCKRETVTGPNEPQNLISNSSFEINGNPSIGGWTFSDSSMWAILPDAPAGGGRYSIMLRPVGHNTFSYNSVIVRVALAAGSRLYRLSCWAKRTTERAGSINLFLGSGNIDTMTPYQTIVVTDSVWSYYSRDVTLANSSNDSVVVALFGGYSPISYPEDSTFFDLCKFEILN